MEKPYKIFPALYDEAGESWIWFTEPPLPSRTVVRVKNPQTKRVVYCESREIDPNFLKHYNQHPRSKIENPDEALVIGEWYRDALGGFETTHTSASLVKLDIKPAPCPGWRGLRASCQHPDIAVRIGTRLGVIGLWLGVVGLLPTVLELGGIERECRLWPVVAVAVAGVLAGWCACRGVKSPRS